MVQINPGHRKNIRSSRNDSKSSFTGKSAAYTVEKPCSPAHVLRFEGKCFIFRPCLLTTSAYSPGQEREETGWSASEGPNSCPREARTAVMEAMAEASFWKWIRTRMTCVLFFMIQNKSPRTGEADKAPRNMARTANPSSGKCPPVPLSTAAMHPPWRRRPGWNGKAKALNWKK